MSRAKGACAIFLFLQGFYALTSTGRVHVTDEASALSQARAFVETGSLTVPTSTTGFVFYGKPDQRGRLRAPTVPFTPSLLRRITCSGSSCSSRPAYPRTAAT